MQIQADGRRAERQRLIQWCLRVFISLHRKINTLKYFAKNTCLLWQREKERNSRLAGSRYLIAVFLFANIMSRSSVVENKLSVTKGAPLTIINVQVVQCGLSFPKIKNLPSQSPLLPPPRQLPYYILQFKIHFILLQSIVFNEKLLMSQEVAVYSCVLWKSQWRIRNWSKIGYSCMKEHTRKIEPSPPYAPWLRFSSHPSGLFLFPCTCFHLLLWNLEVWLLICCSALFFSAEPSELWVRLYDIIE